MIKLYNTYNKVKDVFVKPTLHFKFCKWTNNSLLPVWRRGNRINLWTKYSDYKIKWFYARIEECEWSESGKKNHPILSRLFKPVYTLPIWLSFFIFNHDLIWKTKWDEYRYEYPPQLSIVLFGWSFNWWLSAPNTGRSTDNDDYWELILEFIDKRKLFPEKSNKEILVDLRDKLGFWSSSNGDYIRVRKAFLKINIDD